MKKILFILLAVGSAALGAGQPGSGGGIWVPNSTEPMPKYWTWTNNRASGSAMSNGGYIKDAWLYVGSQLVNEVHPDWYPMSISLAAMWDASHFPEGSEVTITFQVVDMEYGWFPVPKAKTGKATVKNRVILFEHHLGSSYRPDSDGVDIADTKFSLFGYETHKHKWDGWVKSHVESDSYDATAAYFNTHGNVGVLADDTDDHLLAADIDNWRMTINGTGYPPYNSTGNVPTNYVHLETCLSNTDNSFAEGWLWPYANHYGGWTEDQAVFGFSGVTDIRDRANMAAVQWPLFEDCRTVGHMRSVLLELGNYAEENEEIFVRIKHGNQNERNIQVEADCPIWGDFYTRLKGVYTGNDNHPVDWHRPL